MSQKQRAQRQLTSKDKWRIFFNQWTPSGIKKIWKEEYGSIEAKKAKVHSKLDNILHK